MNKQLSERAFRANPDYELTLFDRLPAEQRTLLADLEKDPQFYGLLQPRAGAALGAKSVCRDTALLFATLAAQPGPLPRYALRQAGTAAVETMAQLVLDGLLAMEHEGRWLTGVAALPYLDLGPRPVEGAVGPLACLAQDALHYAAALSLTDASALSMRLYRYNTLPMSAARLRSLPTSAALECDCSPGKRGEWAALPSSPSTEAWSAWRARRRTARSAGHAFKLYVSPLPEALPEAFAATIEAATEWGAHQFKLGRAGHQLLRPDKLVVYFDQRPALEAAAAQIARALTGAPVQGVPFTAPSGGEESGLVSWGYDPPADSAAPEWLRRESWRLRIANRLGAALALAKSNPAADVSAAEFACARLRLEGVDTETWSPKEVRS